jgi:hypothetical protein
MWIAAAGLVLLPAATAAQVSPNPLIAPVVFHWEQAQNPFPTLEGGSVGTTSLAFWRRQIKNIERAGFTAVLFQVVERAPEAQRQHLRAVALRRAEGGPLPPRIVPFFAAESFVEYDEPKDVNSAAGLDHFYQVVRGFFRMYAEAFPGRPGEPGGLNPDQLATVDGRVFIALWHVPLTRAAPPDFFARLNDRLQQEFGFRAYWSAHVTFASGNPDDINFLFNGSAPMQRGVNDRYPAVDLLTAFWPPNLAFYRADLFARRAGGATYAAAWDQVIASGRRPVIVLVESYNEITEGSHLMPSWSVDHRPGDGHWTGPPDDPRCLTAPCHPVEFTDGWGSANPWHFLDLSHEKIRQWIEGAPSAADREPPHVLILEPRTGDRVRGLAPLRVVAADNRSLAEVRIYVDGRRVLVAPGSVEALLKTHLLEPGRHQIAAYAMDATGEFDSDVSDFFVDAPVGADVSSLTRPDAGLAAGRAGRFRPALWPDGDPADHGRRHGPAALAIGAGRRGRRGQLVDDVQAA